MCHRQDDLAERRSVRHPGVLAPGFDASDLTDRPDLWTPFQLDPNIQDQAHYFRSVARIEPGITLTQAQSKLAQSARCDRRSVVS
jgi:hypothetical protein